MEAMMNEMFAQNKDLVKVRPTYLWTTSDVQKWYRRHCSEYLAYIDNFSKNEITGRALLRITDHSLLRMGISNYSDREAIWREIVKQRLKTDLMEIRDMERMATPKHKDKPLNYT